MWNTVGKAITMTEGDWGVALPATLSGITMAQNDELRLTIKKAAGGEALVTKEYSDISQNQISIVLTEAESAKLPAGSYVYGIDWYQDGAFMCCVVERAAFKVVRKV